jgi:hypothetical protein
MVTAKVTVTVTVKVMVGCRIRRRLFGFMNKTGVRVSVRQWFLVGGLKPA